MPSRLFHHVRTSLWFVPVACVVAGVLLSTVTLAVDRAGDYEVDPASNGPEDQRWPWRSCRRWRCRW